MTQTSEVVLLDANERIRRFGIECTGPSGDGIFFKAGHWRPGGEYIQKLLIKNVSTSVKKLKYRLPSTRYFSMEYPEVITLSPGLFKIVDVVFRPVEHDPYDDTIYIRMLDGIEGNGFHVPVKATIDKLILKAPEGIDLGYCPTHQTSYRTFSLENAGEIDAPFKWDVPLPFKLEPSQGVIPVGCSQDIVISIIPQDASVFVSIAVCHVGTGVHAIIPDPLITTKLSAIGKYAYITLSEPEINFGEVISGITPEKREVVLRNESVVPAEFDLIRFDKDRDEVFHIHPKSGVILPQSEITVTVNYSALAMGLFSLDRYAYRTPGNCNTALTIKGMAMPPTVSLYKQPVVNYKNDEEIIHDSTMNPLLNSGTMSSTSKKEGAPDFSLNFRDVEVGKVETRILYLRNDSHRDVAFSIIADENGIFKMSPKQGVIPALFKSFAVTVVFSPPKPSNYYRRFFVLVGDALPLFYDCLGTGYIRAKGKIKEQRPAPIRHAHVQAYRNRVVQRMGHLSPDELDFLYNANGDPSFFAQIGFMGTRALSVTSLQRPVTRTGESIRTLVAPAHEFFVSDSDMTCRDITINKTSFDFGYSPCMASSTAKHVTIYNRTNSKVVVDWNIPQVKDISEELVSNLMMESSREKDIITEDRQIKLLSILQAFRVDPPTIEINPGKSHTFDVTFFPNQSNRNYVSEIEAFVYFKNQRTFRLVNDHSLTPPWSLTVNAVGHTFNTGQLLAKGKLVGANTKEGKLVFPACFEGESLYQTVMLRNTSNLPSTFQILLGWDEMAGTKPVDETFTVKPSMGEIAAEDFVLICIRFSPIGTKKYIQLLRCMINGEISGKLMLEGAGATPYLVLPDLQAGDFTKVPEQFWGLSSQPLLYIPKGPQGVFYLKPTCVGLTSTKILKVKNGSRLPLKFKIELNNQYSDGIISISPDRGLLKGNEDMSITLTFAPTEAIVYEMKLQVFVYPIGGKTKRVIDANQPGPANKPELLQTLSVQLVAPGEVGALIFDPSRVTIDVRLVDSPEIKYIFLENISDSDIKYKLIYKEEFTPDSASRSVKRTESDIMSLESVPTFESMQSPGTLVAQNKFQHSLFCDHPEGILPARSRNRLIFTYHPIKAGLYEFLLFAQVQALDKFTGKPILLSNDEAALLRVSQTKRESTTTFKENNFNNTMESLAILPLVSNVTARAAYPKLLFEDIRTDVDIQISDIEYLWKRFTFAQINYDLAIPMTHEEVRLVQSSSPDLSKLITYNFEFAPAVINSPLQTILIKVRNNGFLTSSFHMHFPNEKQLDLEAWCDEDDPSDELNRIISIIEELKVFSIEPKRGVLQPGETCLITVTYSHNSLKYDGLHNLPILTKLDNGKWFYINLIGQTLPTPHYLKNRKSSANVGASTTTFNSVVTTGNNSVTNANPFLTSNISDILIVVCVDKDNTFHLAPVPLGLSYKLAPRQRTELINVSGVNVLYEVEKESIESFITENYNVPLLRIANPSGMIPAGGSIFLEWYFYPLEAKTYSIPIRIRYASSIPTLSSMTAHTPQSAPPKSGMSRTTASGQGYQGPMSSRTGWDRTAIPTPQFNGSFIPTVFQYLDFTLKPMGYDTREDKPVPFGSTYDGGLPPITPILQLPKQQVFPSQDLIDFQIIPTLCTTHRVIMLHNKSPNSSFEFVVDESSCVLCMDMLMSVNPAYGRIEPNNFAYIDFSFRANSQPIIFEENIKIMVKEILKRAPSRKGGRLLDKIKKKAQSSDHESVVSRNTTSRSLMMDNVNVPEGKKATIPITVNVAGEVIVSPSKTQIINTLQDVSILENSVMNNQSQAYGNSKVLEFNVNSEPSLNPRVKSSTVGFAADNNFNKLESRQSNKSFMSKTVPTPNMDPSRNGSALSPSRSVTSEFSRGSRSGMMSPSNRSEGGRTAMSGDSGTTLFGVTNILIIRLKGEVLYIDTVRDIIERNQSQKGTTAVNDFVITPTMLGFIPPVAYQSDYNPNKGKINISTIKNRDIELRNIAEVVITEVFREVLQTNTTVDYLLTTLSGSNEKCIPIRDSDKYDQRPQESYGVYFNEIKDIKPLHYRLILELKHKGYLNYYEKEHNKVQLVEESLTSTSVTLQWTKDSDEYIMTDEYNYTLTLEKFRDALIDFNVHSVSTPALYAELDKLMVTLAKEIEGLVPYDYVKNEIIPSNNTICISTLINSLSYKSSLSLSKIVNNICKVRQRKTNNNNNNNNNNNKNGKDTQKLEDLKNELHTAVKNNEFFDLASETLGNLMLNLIQDVHASLISEGESSGSNYE